MRNNASCSTFRIRYLFLSGYLLALFAASDTSAAALIFPDSPGPVADKVFGQPGFITNTAGTSLDQMSGPSDILFDSVGRMYIADLNNDRILIFANQDDTRADFVIGGPISGALPGLTGVPSGAGADRLNAPTFLALFDGPDTSVLFVSEQLNQRVLGYILRQPGFSFLSDTLADYVFGQPTFDTNVISNNGTGASLLSAVGLRNPAGLSILDTGASTISLFVADRTNLRVLRYDINKSLFGLPNSSMDTIPDELWGQPDFMTSELTFAVSREIIRGPLGVASTPDRLFIAAVQPRVVVESLTDPDTSFDGVYGQPDFTSQTAGNDTTSLASLFLSVAIGPTKNVLAIIDRQNHRILLHTDTSGADIIPDDIIGDTNFVAPVLTGPSAQSLRLPTAAYFRSDSEVWVTDFGNNRALRFDRGSNNTPVGNNVNVTESFAVQGFLVTVKFASVSQAGNTEIRLLDSIPPLGTDFRLTSDSLCPSSDNMIFQIGTTAIFTTAQVTINFNDNACLKSLSVPNKLSLEMLHFDLIPPDPDTVTFGNANPGTNEIKSIDLTTLSPFVVAEKIFRDLTPPTITIEIESGHVFHNYDEPVFKPKSFVTLSATDSSGVSTFEWRIDDGEFQSYSEPFQIGESVARSKGANPKSETHVLTARASDVFGNTEETHLIFRLASNGQPRVDRSVQNLTIQRGTLHIFSMLESIQFDLGEEIVLTIVYENSQDVYRPNNPNPTPDGGQTIVSILDSLGREVHSQRRHPDPDPAKVTIGMGEKLTYSYSVISKMFPNGLPAGRYTLVIQFRGEFAGHHAFEVMDDDSVK
ncbi:MAG: hypothetical protein AAB229_05485 [Candidatus Hydrogenedentota bacterium]